MCTLQNQMWKSLWLTGVCISYTTSVATCRRCQGFPFHMILIFFFLRLIDWLTDTSMTRTASSHVLAACRSADCWYHTYHAAWTCPAVHADSCALAEWYKHRHTYGHGQWKKRVQTMAGMSERSWFHSSFSTLTDHIMYLTLIHLARVEVHQSVPKTAWERLVGIWAEV